MPQAGHGSSWSVPRETEIDSGDRVIAGLGLYLILNGTNGCLLLSCGDEEKPETVVNGYRSNFPYA
jgi:hypothetical protein